MEGSEYRGGDAGWMGDEEHWEVMERLCVQCGEPAAFFPGERCEACWNVAGRPLPRFPGVQED